jgi:hypothetical protein
MLRRRLLEFLFRVRAAIILEFDELGQELPNWYTRGINKFNRPEKPIELGLERTTNDGPVHAESSFDAFSICR